MAGGETSPGERFTDHTRCRQPWLEMDLAVESRYRSVRAKAGYHTGCCLALCRLPAMAPGAGAFSMALRSRAGSRRAAAALVKVEAAKLGEAGPFQATVKVHATAIRRVTSQAEEAMVEAAAPATAASESAASSAAPLPQTPRKVEGRGKRKRAAQPEVNPVAQLASIAEVAPIADLRPIAEVVAQSQQAAWTKASLEEAMSHLSTADPSMTPSQ